MVSLRNGGNIFFGYFLGKEFFAWKKSFGSGITFLSPLLLLLRVESVATQRLSPQTEIRYAPPPLYTTIPAHNLEKWWWKEGKKKRRLSLERKEREKNQSKLLRHLLYLFLTRKKSFFCVCGGGGEAKAMKRFGKPAAFLRVFRIFNSFPSVPFWGRK